MKVCLRPIRATIRVCAVSWVRFWAIVNGAIVVLLVAAALFGEDGVVRHERLRELES